MVTWRTPALAFLWALAEATYWPIMPDAILVPLAVARPESWWRLVPAATAGSLLGGLVSFGLGRRVPDPAPVANLPLVRPAMVEAATRWLAAEGARGLRHQPFAGLPYKVFARRAGGLGVPLWPFVGWTVAARGGRFCFAVAAALLVRRCLPIIGGDGYWPAAVAWAAVFALGLRRMVRSWERLSAPPHGVAPGWPAA